MKIEFFATSDGTGIICNLECKYHTLTTNDAIIRYLDDLIKSNCPDAHKALLSIYGDDRFMSVLRFCKCNWNVNNNIPDVDSGAMHFEYIPCPLRGECRYENVICNPVVKAGLTVREIQIVKLIVEGLSDRDISHRLTISLHTAENHRKNILSKLGLHSKAEITRFAMENNMCS